MSFPFCLHQEIASYVQAGKKNQNAPSDEAVWSTLSTLMKGLDQVHTAYWTSQELLEAMQKAITAP